MITTQIHADQVGVIRCPSSADNLGCLINIMCVRVGVYFYDLIADTQEAGLGEQKAKIKNTQLKYKNQVY